MTVIYLEEQKRFFYFEIVVLQMQQEGDMFLTVWSLG